MQLSRPSPRLFAALAGLLLLAVTFGCVGSVPFPENKDGEKLVEESYQQGKISYFEYVQTKRSFDSRYDPATDPILLEKPKTKTSGKSGSTSGNTTSSTSGNTTSTSN